MMTDDIEKVLFSEEAIHGKVQELGRQISEAYAGKEICAVGILKGAAVFFTDLARAIDVPVRFDFIIASSYGRSTETSGTVKLLKDLDEDIAGKHVIIVEDIIDSGITMNYLMGYFRRRSPASLRLCSLLSKPSRRRVDVPIDYCGWDVPDEFLVGYGMDYDGKYRNLPFVGILKREIYS